LASVRFDAFPCAILAASRAADSMVVQLDVDGLEARLWSAPFTCQSSDDRDLGGSADKLSQLRTGWSGGLA